jgi:hypothetical protein
MTPLQLRFGHYDGSTAFPRAEHEPTKVTVGNWVLHRYHYSCSDSYRYLLTTNEWQYQWRCSHIGSLASISLHQEGRKRPKLTFLRFCSATYPGQGR